ncbi:MAG: hypothetical protein WBH47_20470, partial [Streptosporangiaceae bacterium]
MTSVPDGNGADPADPAGISTQRRREPARRLFAAGLAVVILAVAGWAVLGPTVLVVRHVRVTGAG